MALQKCGLNLNKASKELQPHGTLDFPCAGYSSYYTDKQEDMIPWHWHEELEIVYIKDGHLNLKIPTKSFSLRQGECAVINSNMLHSGNAVIECKLHSLVFSPTLVAGSDDSVFAKKYIQPVIGCNSFSGLLIRMADHENVICWFNRAFEALAQERAGFEFIVRENLSNICFFLYEQFEQNISIKNKAQSQDNLRIRKMFEYIHKNFSDNVSLSDIAKAADIGERECLRCFQKTIQRSPIQYLLKYRIMQSAEMLLKNPAGSISETAAFCGFDSPSNFAKTFKRFYNCTPREYRSLNME